MILKTVRMCLGHAPLQGVFSTARVAPDWVSGECCGHVTSTGIGSRSTGDKLLPLSFREPGHSSCGGLLCGVVESDAGFRSGIVW